MLEAPQGKVSLIDGQSVECVTLTSVGLREKVGDGARRGLPRRFASGDIELAASLSRANAITPIERGGKEWRKRYSFRRVETSLHGVGFTAAVCCQCVRTRNDGSTKIPSYTCIQYTFTRHTYRRAGHGQTGSLHDPGPEAEGSAAAQDLRSFPAPARRLATPN